MDDAVRLLNRPRRVLVFTGAGVSTASGIPDYRGPQGVWKTRRPVEFDEFLRSETARIEYWEYKLEGYELFKNARPNAAHYALVDLEKKGRLEMLVTQNIDGMHQAAGTSSELLIELHGTNAYVKCLACDAVMDNETAFARFKAHRQAPRCQCGGWLKAATISFGQPLPSDLIQRAFAAASRSDAVLAVGSTLMVEPASLVPLIAQQHGASYIIVNRGETAHDTIADVRIEGDVIELLPALVERIR